jgi:two-component system OmpR family response regulator
MSLAEGARRRILAVDDDRAILELVATRLTLAGFDVFSARDGREAIERIGALRPHGMVLDLNMPGVDGFGVLEHLGMAGAARLPTLVLSARHATADVQRAIALGARDYVAKPFRDSQLLLRTARLFRPPVMRRELSDVFDDIEVMIAKTAGAERSPRAA